jgi:hypothetical protein
MTDDPNDPDPKDAYLTFKSIDGSIQRMVTITSNLCYLQVTSIPTNVRWNIGSVNISFSPYPVNYSIELSDGTTTYSERTGLSGQGPHSFTLPNNTGTSIQTVNVIHSENNAVLATFKIIPDKLILLLTAGAYGTGGCPPGMRLIDTPAHLSEGVRKQYTWRYYETGGLVNVSMPIINILRTNYSNGWTYVTVTNGIWMDGAGGGAGWRESGRSPCVYNL